MDDESRQLLQETREIALRSEAALKREIVFRRQLLAGLLCGVLLACAAVAYLMHFERTLD